MKMKTSELEGAALDWAVATVEGYKFGSPRRVLDQVHFALFRPDWGTVGNAALLPDGTWGYNVPRFSTDWSQGGPLIDKYRPVLFPAGEDGVVGFINPNPKCPYVDTSAYDEGFHETYLIAAMRAIVASELGDEVDIPDELLED